MTPWLVIVNVVVELLQESIIIAANVIVDLEKDAFSV
jgi:hypothetical protein